ncbi:DUF6176 family protein [Halobaculum sp. MBLA0147]|uniref:DUF6176 family protein n=1 Tax=Halobaculum sp. MBLA0147 TaxID=3079934 RepID=UPI00352336BE
MPEAILASRRVDPEALDTLREHFDSLTDRTTLFERGLAAENVRTEAAFLGHDADGPVLYYYTERGDDYPPDLDPDDVADEILELGAEHEAALEAACTEPARDEEGELRTLERLFFASAVDE